ncbi:MAG: UDP-N-acetylmuramoyl-L-alanyl-D-glutamate--2,6-diaminopimelate ligase, partial [Clostridia bacterium]|nr:UDP-N-acetylmuramoyl-L-alanyl-D-glutamate--2,6-diaminopimelate ligase [Clostridia bacterium]
MTLKELLRNTEYKVAAGSVDIEIGKIEIDSRKISKGDVFFALTGLGADGHNYIEKAVSLGASAVVAERECDSFGATLIISESSRKMLAWASANYYDHPADKMRLIGVTGTNGKTTVTHIIKKILDMKGAKTGIIGTNHYLIGDKELPSTGTTPEAMELHWIFKEMYEAGCEYVIMETSSHALDLDRCLGLTFDVGVFTNLTQDHLNYHIDMENYASAKAKLFAMSRIAVLNNDDSWCKVMKKTASKVYTYGIEKNADMRAENIEYSERGVSFNWKFGNSVVPMKMAIPGKFSVYNALAGVGACAALGLRDEDIYKGLLMVRGV